MNKVLPTGQHESELFSVLALVGDNRWKVNSYLVTEKCSRRSFLIDCGGTAGQLLTTLSGMGTLIEFVLLTHGHFDHMSSAAALCEAFSVPCVIHPGDARLLRQAPLYAFRFDGSQVEVPRTAIVLDSPNAPNLSSFGIRVILTPGHTPGGVCYGVDKFIFSGDTLLRETVGRIDQPGGDLNDLTRSVNDLLGSVPDDGLILPGHGKPWTTTEARAWWLAAAEAPPVLDSFL